MRVVVDKDQKIKLAKLEKNKGNETQQIIITGVYTNGMAVEFEVPGWGSHILEQEINASASGSTPHHPHPCVHSASRQLPGSSPPPASSIHVLSFLAAPLLLHHPYTFSASWQLPSSCIIRGEASGPGPRELQCRHEGARGAEASRKEQRKEPCHLPQQ